MRISRLTQDIIGFQIISVKNGESIGKVEDVLVDSKNLELAGVVTFKGNLLDSTIKAIPRKDIQVWGQDVILVSDSDLICEQNQLEGFENMESVDEDIKGKNVLNTKGEQIAELDDVVIDSNARIVGYHLSKVFMEGPVADTKRIHVKTTEVLGADALIIDTSKLYRWVFES